MFPNVLPPSMRYSIAGRQTVMKTGKCRLRREGRAHRVIEIVLTEWMECYLYLNVKLHATDCDESTAGRTACQTSVFHVTQGANA